MATELENFYRDNRIREADSVNNIYNDPRYASTIFNSSVPLPQLEKNIKQSKGQMFEPSYNPTFRDESSDYITSALEYLESKGIMDKSVREGKATSRDVSKSFTGTKDSMGLADFIPFVGSIFATQEGQRKVMEAEPDALKRQMGLLGFMRQPFQTYLDRPELSEGAFDMSAGSLGAYGVGLVAKPMLKNFANSLSKKLKGETSIVPTKQEVGALPKVMANTKLQAPSMVMTDPKVVDEFGFYSEAERQAKMMQQNKGSGAQFAGFLLNKGVKQDELDAIGLTDLFKNDNVTKKEIVDTIELNKVQLLETRKTGKSYTDPNDVYIDDFDPETFTSIRNGEEGFKTADEVKEAYETGKYSEPTIEYDAQIRTYANSDETEPMKLYGKINTHMPTQYKILELQNLSEEGQDITDIYLTFRPNADVKDWRNSLESQEYIDQINEARGGYLGELQKTENLTLDDFAEIIQDRSAQTFEEATVRLKGATIKYGDYDPGSIAKWEGSTQDGGTNYKELLLTLEMAKRGLKLQTKLKKPTKLVNTLNLK